MAPRPDPPFSAATSAACCSPRRGRGARSDGDGRDRRGRARENEDDAIRERRSLSSEASACWAPRRRVRRTSWHMDFIYQLGGVRQVEVEQHPGGLPRRAGRIRYGPGDGLTAGANRPHPLRQAFAPGATQVAPRFRTDDPLAEHGARTRRTPLRPLVTRRGGLLDGPDDGIRGRDATPVASWAAPTFCPITSIETPRTQTSTNTCRLGVDPTRCTRTYIAISNPPCSVGRTDLAARRHVPRQQPVCGRPKAATSSSPRRSSTTSRWTPSSSSTTTARRRLRAAATHAHRASASCSAWSRRSGRSGDDGRPEAPIERGGALRARPRSAVPIAPVRVLVDRRGQPAHDRRAEAPSCASSWRSRPRCGVRTARRLSAPSRRVWLRQPSSLGRVCGVAETLL